MLEYEGGKKWMFTFSEKIVSAEAADTMLQIVHSIAMWLARYFVVARALLTAKIQKSPGVYDILVPRYGLLKFRDF